MTAYKRGIFNACLGVQALSRHVAKEERLMLSLSEAEQETLSALLGKLIAGL